MGKSGNIMGGRTDWEEEGIPYLESGEPGAVALGTRAEQAAAAR